MGSKAVPGTAVVTGASSGLGEVFAERLAVRGHNLILIARRRGLLEALAARLQDKHAVRCEPIVADLAHPADVHALSERLSSTEDLEMLVNNAGFGTRGEFASVPWTKQEAMLAVHVVAPVQLARAALPRMIERARGAIINVASVAGLVVSPGSVLYGATKAFLVFWSESLAAEVAGTGVRVQALCPGFTYTGFHDTEEYADMDRSEVPRALWLSAEYVVDTSLAALGRRSVVCVPSWKYRAIVALGRNRVTGPVLQAIARAKRK